MNPAGCIFAVRNWHHSTKPSPGYGLLYNRTSFCEAGQNSWGQLRIFHFKDLPSKKENPPWDTLNKKFSFYQQPKEQKNATSESSNCKLIMIYITFRSFCRCYLLKRCVLEESLSLDFWGIWYQQSITREWALQNKQIRQKNECPLNIKDRKGHMQIFIHLQAEMDFKFHFKERRNWSFSPKTIQQ